MIGNKNHISDVQTENIPCLCLINKWLLIFRELLSFQSQLLHHLLTPAHDSPVNAGYSFPVAIQSLPLSSVVKVSSTNSAYSSPGSSQVIRQCLLTLIWQHGQKGSRKIDERWLIMGRQDGGTKSVYCAKLAFPLIMVKKCWCWEFLKPPWRRDRELV